jgi:hypothetical protein
MPPPAAELCRLGLLVERLVDADLLLAEDGGVLLAMVRAGQRSAVEGDRPAVVAHVSGFARCLESLLPPGLPWTDAAQPALEMARQIVDAGSR